MVTRLTTNMIGNIFDDMLINKYNFMHNYNVGNRYTTSTKVGNWYEEKELDQYQFKEYLYQKERGNNLTLNNTFKVGFSHQEVSRVLYRSRSLKRIVRFLIIEIIFNCSATALTLYSPTTSINPYWASRPTLSRPPLLKNQL